MDLLFLLVEKRGELVTREEVADRLWGTTVFVDIDQSINTAIRKVRIALHDDPERPRFVETVIGKGYRFAAPVISPKESPEEENRADAFKRQPSAIPDHMPIAPVMSDGQSAQAPGVLAVSRTQRWKIVMPLSFLLIAGLLAGGLVWRSRPTTRIGQHTGNPTERWLTCDSLIQPTAAR